ncbi:MAG: AvaI/BsoBI family type II restriction endonuclease [Thermodesulfovibrionia bacterium]|nr:AvaI/BsoBI family type II restriction endonuclease [Thermodesulfovibrionia bacterium]
MPSYCTPKELSTAIKNPSLYIALGELKGGIDPAGADEHWKTARTSLIRIQKAFSKKGFSPDIFLSELLLKTAWQMKYGSN